MDEFGEGDVRPGTLAPAPVPAPAPRGRIAAAGWRVCAD
jgi:hypothetical protein